MTRVFSLLLIVLITLLSTGCNDQSSTNGETATMENSTYPSPEEVRQALQIVKRAKILFAHKSVGTNILSGLQLISERNKVPLNIEEIGKTTPQEKAAFAHWMPGENGNPRLKIDGFYDQIQGVRKFKPQVAFMKFCFLDVTESTNVDELFNYYKQKMEALQAAHSDIDFVHFTVPLMSRSYSLKDRVKHLLGMSTWNDVSNEKRERYNQLIRNNFPAESIFDIARIESTRPDGSRVELTNDGKVYYAMDPDYTSDGGHLNPRGQRLVAEEFTLFLAKSLNQTAAERR